jgi:CheY-like chemotaxis protein
MAKVLLVDGDAERLKTTHQALSAAGYDVLEAQSGSFVLTMLDWDRPDLVVSHADIPEMDGYELCSIIRSDPKTRDIPFLLLAGPTGPTSGAAARAGVDMVLGGQFKPSDVVGSVRRLA